MISKVFDIPAMVGSGTFLRAMNAEIALPENLIEIIDGKDKDKSAETACGAVVENWGQLAPEVLLMARKSM